MKIKTIGDLIDAYNLPWHKYDFSWQDSGDYRNLHELLDSMGYVYADNEVQVGDYNEIRCYKGCKIIPGELD